MGVFCFQISVWPGKVIEASFMSSTYICVKYNTKGTIFFIRKNTRKKTKKTQQQQRIRGTITYSAMQIEMPHLEQTL